MAHIKELTKQLSIRDQHRHIIGGSSVASIMGIGAYSCPLREQKTLRGDEFTNPFHGNDATERGNILEPIAASYYSQKTARKLRKVPRRFVELPEFLTWRCLCGITHEPASKTICETCMCDLPRPIVAPLSDYEILNDARGPERGTGILSIKAPNADNYRKVVYNGLDQAYVIQLQIEIWAWLRKWGAYQFFSVEPQVRGIEFDIDYDNVIAESAAHAIITFLRRVENGPDYDKLPPESSACRQCQYRTACHGQAMLDAATEGQGMQFTTFEDSEVVNKLVQIAELRQIRKDAEDESDRLVNEVGEKITQMLAFETPDPTDPSMRLRIYYKPQAGRRTFKLTDFEKKNKNDKALMDALKDYITQGMPSRPLKIYRIPSKVG